MTTRFVNGLSKPTENDDTEAYGLAWKAMEAEKGGSLKLAADLWSKLPQEQQQALFERAVLLGHRGERDESLREQLAKFLHEHHARTHAP